MTKAPYFSLILWLLYGELIRLMSYLIVLTGFIYILHQSQIRSNLI